MLMTDIRDYIQHRGQASLQDLARHFHLQESAVEQMLDFWVKKGSISVIAPLSVNCASASHCGDCKQCDDSVNQIYISKTLN